jgi:hypothetical protein
VNYHIVKQVPGEGEAPVDYLSNLEALHRMGIYFSEELERLGSNASVLAHHATEVIKLELDLRRLTNQRTPRAKVRRIEPHPLLRHAS